VTTLRLQWRFVDPAPANGGYTARPTSSRRSEALWLGDGDSSITAVFPRSTKTAIKLWRLHSSYVFDATGPLAYTIEHLNESAPGKIDDETVVRKRKARRRVVVVAKDVRRK